MRTRATVTGASVAHVLVLWLQSPPLAHILSLAVQIVRELFIVRFGGDAYQRTQRLVGVCCDGVTIWRGSDVVDVSSDTYIDGGAAESRAVDADHNFRHHHGLERWAEQLRRLEKVKSDGRAFSGSRGQHSIA